MGEGERGEGGMGAGGGEMGRRGERGHTRQELLQAALLPAAQRHSPPEKKNLPKSVCMHDCG